MMYPSHETQNMQLNQDLSTLNTNVHLQVPNIQMTMPLQGSFVSVSPSASPIPGTMSSLGMINLAQPMMQANMIQMPMVQSAPIAPICPPSPQLINTTPFQARSPTPQHMMDMYQVPIGSVPNVPLSPQNLAYHSSPSPLPNLPVYQMEMPGHPYNQMMYTPVLMDVPQTTQDLNQFLPQTVMNATAGYPLYQAVRSVSRSPSPARRNSISSDHGSFRGSIHGFSDHERPMRNRPRRNSRGSQRKFGHRSKQRKIEEVHARVMERFINNNLWTEEQLRGPDVVRTHVKSYKDLVRIEDALVKIEALEDVIIQQVAAPISMKNDYQKKGFILYFKVETQAEVETILGVFQSFPDNFNKSDVALTAEEKKLRQEAMSPTAGNIGA